MDISMEDVEIVSTSDAEEQAELDRLHQTSLGREQLDSHPKDSPEPLNVGITLRQYY
jgi:hypothetical protein